MKLYTYWRSTSSYRVRIALALKNLDAEHVPIHLVRNGGEQHAEAYRAINPQERVPTLELDDGAALTQSSAILEYLEETYPTPPLLPADLTQRAKVRAVAAIIGSDIQPLHNLSPLTYLRRTLGQAEPEVSAWIATWVGSGLKAVEALIGDGPYCFGDAPSLADVYLIPQLYAARRFDVPLDDYPRIRRVEAEAEGHPAFVKAHPANQSDAE
ncbi:maleylacetoacetate isomerase [Labrys okinawensis]|uniref:Maleylacetoacetate isomerase n=1 Tax=Labrys okinawensis TaxID=346911 RepID=A0A2S9Q541_9HYPH|nr:maleylacetoacetate isomerase [Labrys okinawensis]PRH84466.1 maleylacetoacetate isomerase [Labrys okinawensis]